MVLSNAVQRYMSLLFDQNHILSCDTGLVNTRSMADTFFLTNKMLKRRMSTVGATKATVVAPQGNAVTVSHGRGSLRKKSTGEGDTSPSLPPNTASTYVPLGAVLEQQGEAGSGEAGSAGSGAEDTGKMDTPVVMDTGGKLRTESVSSDVSQGSSGRPGGGATARRPLPRPPRPAAHRTPTRWQKAATMAVTRRGSVTAPPGRTTGRRASIATGGGRRTPDQDSSQALEREDFFRKLMLDVAKQTEENEEMRRQYATLQDRSTGLQAQLERAQKLLEGLRSESSRKTGQVDKLQNEFSSISDRMRSLENKAMEVEKLEIVVDRVKKNLDQTQQEVRERERELRVAERAMTDKDRLNADLESQLRTLRERNADLKLQVREEIIRCQGLEKNLATNVMLEQTVEEAEVELQRMRKSMEDAQLVAKHARQCLREERTKTQKIEASTQELSTLRDEMEMAQAETISVKRFLTAKDKLLQEKTKKINVMKCVLKSHLTEAQYEAAMAEIDGLQQPPEPPRDRPNGNITFEDSSMQAQKKRNKPLSHSPSSSSQTSLIHRIYEEEEYSNSTTSLHNSHDTFSNQDKTNIKTAIVRPRVYNETFSDFRSPSPSGSDVTNKTHGSLCSSQIEVRSLGVDGGTPNRVRSAGTPQRSQSMRVHSGQGQIGLRTPMGSSSDFGTCSRTSSMRSISGEPRGQSSCSGSQNGIMGNRLFTSPAESKLSQQVHMGDRVVVDLSRRQDTKEQLETAVVKYVGQLDSEKMSGRLLVGLRLDEPIGDTDGLYKEKRYFRVPIRHGKIVRISKIKSVFDKESGMYNQLNKQTTDTPQATSSERKPTSHGNDHNPEEIIMV